MLPTLQLCYLDNKELHVSQCHTIDFENAIHAGQEAWTPWTIWLYSTCTSKYSLVLFASSVTYLQTFNTSLARLSSNTDLNECKNLPCRSFSILSQSLLELSESLHVRVSMAAFIIVQLINYDKASRFSFQHSYPYVKTLNSKYTGLNNYPADWTFLPTKNESHSQIQDKAVNLLIYWSIA